MPVSNFFRKPDIYSAIEIAATDLGTAHIQDIGTGSGIHTLYFQSKIMSVAVVDICQKVLIYVPPKYNECFT